MSDSSNSAVRKIALIIVAKVVVLVGIMVVLVKTIWMLPVLAFAGFDLYRQVLPLREDATG